MKQIHKVCVLLGSLALASIPLIHGNTFGQVPSANGGVISGPHQSSGTPEASISDTTLTWRQHQIAPGASASSLEGTSCPTSYTMLSGACHPGYNDQVKIINQYPNTALNTWRCGFKNNTSSVRNTYVYTLCGSSGDGGSTVVHDLQIRRYTNTNLTNTEADSILSDATSVLQTNDGPGDVACDVSMERTGNVTTFSDGDGSIDSSSEFNALIALPGHIKAVNQINWCGGLIPNVIGCAPVPGNSLAIVRYTSSLEGILWLHEFGHNKGLSHRNNDANAVMNGTIASTRLRVNQAECDAFKASPLVSEESVTEMPHEHDANMLNIKDFVHQIFIHGVPYNEATKYSSSVVPTLLDMLQDSAEEQHWPNIVVLLGMIGDESVVDPLIAFIENSDDNVNLSRPHYVAKTSAVMAMGYTINKTGNQKALSYLKASLSPEAWAAKDVGVASFQTSKSERDYDFSKHAILGLALSGHPDGKAALNSLQQPGDTESMRAFQTQVGDLITEALNEHNEISRGGLAKYYQKLQK